MLAGLEYLKRILFDQDIEEFNRIRMVYLLDPAELDAYTHIGDYLVKYQQLPPVSFLNDLIPLYQEHPLEYWVDQVNLRYQKHLLNTIQRITSMSSDKPGELLDSITNLLSAQLQDTSTDIATQDQLVEVFRKHLERLKEQHLKLGQLGLPTGWPTFDKTFGGYAPGEVYVFCGRPKLGKTILMIYSAISSLLINKKVLIVSMEMMIPHILQRISACLLPMAYSLYNTILTNDMEKKLLLEIEKIKQNLIVIEGRLDQNLLTLNQFIKVKQPDIIFIDGAYLLKSKTVFKSMWEQVLTVIQEIKQLAMHNHIPIVCSYQMNRSTTKNLKIDQIALSDAIGQIASVVFGIRELDILDRREILMLASRDSKLENVFIHWDWQTMNFKEVNPNEMNNTSYEMQDTITL
jgi:replicative DNA helicase